MLRWLTFLLVVLSFSSCVEKRDLSANQVIVKISYTPDGLHPTNENSSNHSFICKFIHPTLMDINLEKEEYEPLLLARLPEPDSTGLIYKYTLRDDVRWDDGSELTAQDIIFSTKLLLCPLTDNSDVRPVYTSVIDSAFTIDPKGKTFFVRHKTKHVSNQSIFSETFILQKSIWDPKDILKQLSFKNIHSDQFQSSVALDEWFNKYNSSDNGYLPENIKGLGPYNVIAFEKDNYVLLERKKNWWGDQDTNKYFANEPEKILFKVIADPAASYLAIKNEEIDFTQSAGGISKLIRLQRLDYFNESYHSEFIDSYSYSYIGLNMRPDGIKHLPFFTDKRVRRAMAYLTPVEEMLEVLSYGKPSRQASIVPTSNSKCDTTLKYIPFDVKKAEELLDAAGWKDTDGDFIRDKMINGKKTPFSFKLNYVSGGGKESIFMIKEAMKKAGIEVVPNPMDFNTLYKNASDHTFDAMMGGWLSGATYSDPIQLWGTESWANKGSNFVGFGDAESDSLIEAANTTLDPEKHLDAYQALQRKIYEEQPYVFIASGVLPIIAHKRFENTEFFKNRPNAYIGNYKLKTEGL
jgi:peptide/nickel transport system substrate-binding protein